MTPGAKSLLLARAFLHRSAGSSFFADSCPIGCAQGDCGIPSLISFQVPAQVAHLGAYLFKDDVEAFLEAIPEGRDLSGVWPEFAIWLLTDPEDGVLRRAKTDEERAVISMVADLYRERAPGDDPRWQKAAYIAYAAHAAYAAYAAYIAYAAYAAYAADAAYAAYVAAAASAAQKVKFLSLLRSALVTLVVALKPPKRDLKRISASQVQAFRSCPRKWVLQSVFGVRSPSTSAQKLGTDIHAAIEAWLTKRELPIPGAKIAALVAPAIATLPEPGLDLAVEQGFSVPLIPGEMEMTGFVDLASPRDLPRVVVTDHKTSSSPRWRKTSAELQADVQALVYAFWAWTLKEPPSVMNPLRARPGWGALREGVESVEFRHHYVGTSRPDSALVRAEMPWPLVAKGWAEIVVSAKEMRDLAASCPDDPLRVEGDSRSCDAYGGCHFKKVGYCRDMLVSATGLTKKTGGDMDKLEDLKARMERRRAALGLSKKEPTPADQVESALKASVEATAPPAEVKPAGNGQVFEKREGEGWTLRQPRDDREREMVANAEAASKGAEGIVPPDAAQRAQTAEEIAANRAEAEAAPKKRGRPKKMSTTASPAIVETALIKAPAEPASVKPSAPADPPPATVAGLVLVDCLTTTPSAFERAFGRVEAVDAWVSKVSLEVSSAWGVLDPSLIDYGKGKGAMKVGLLEAFAKNPPPSPCYLHGFGRWADVFLEVAQEAGWSVVRGIR